MSGDREHEFTLALGGEHGELTDEMLDRFFEAGCDDALVSISAGRLFVDFARPGANMKDALVKAIRDVRAAGFEVDRIATCELVTKAEIARRLGRTRQRVGQWVADEGGFSAFPPPACPIIDGHSLWRWCEVAQWAYENNLAKRTAWEQAQDVELINSILNYCSRKQGAPVEFEGLVEALCGSAACPSCSRVGETR